jgi:hypothetical protein
MNVRGFMRRRLKHIFKNFLCICREKLRKAVKVRLNITSSSIDIRTFISFTAIQLHKIFTAVIEPDVFIVQKNDIKAKLTFRTVLLILYHHMNPRSEFQIVRLFARVLQAGKSKILQAEKSKELKAGKS